MAEKKDKKYRTIFNLVLYNCSKIVVNKENIYYIIS